MPNLASAKKRMRQNERCREANSAVKNRMKTLENKVMKSLDTEEISQETLSCAFSAIDKAWKKGIIKKNTAARKKSKLAKRAKKLTA